MMDHYDWNGRLLDEPDDEPAVTMSEAEFQRKFLITVVCRECGQETKVLNEGHDSDDRCVDCLRKERRKLQIGDWPTDEILF
jgi:hypothetical protein